MNPAVMTTGPGVIRPMAKGVEELALGEPVVLGDDPVAQQRNDGQAGAEDQGAGLQEEQSQGEQGSAGRRGPEEGRQEDRR